MTFNSCVCRISATTLAWQVCGLWLLVLGNPSGLRAADFAEARSAGYRGEYELSIALAKAEVDRGIWNDSWSRQLVESLNTLGRYPEACAVYEQVASKFSNSIPLRVLAAHSYRMSGKREVGDKLLDEIPDLVQAAPWRFSDRDNLLAIGKYLLAEGEDARAVLDAFFDRSLKVDPKFVEAHLAIAELALDKADFQEAVKSLEAAKALRPEDPNIHYLLAKAWAPSDAERATAELQQALDLNPRHVDSLLFQSMNLIDAEDYEAAEELLERALAVNPALPTAWALRAAIAHLRGDYKSEGECRGRALDKWDLNPEVDFLIGKTLSKHYRFQEAVNYSRRSLKMRPDFLPARFQLAQDLLRVGADAEAWTIVDQVAASDSYNVVAFNLKTLQQRLAQFTTLEAPGFIIRMDAREAKVYGPQVVELLQAARAKLAAKYQVELKQPVTVEIFPEQSDFAIRTFGLPGGAGFLGVCFGSLITANSPASQGDSPANWESVLWHEFCHVITLNKTQNRMPRWLSEGISVYEEVQRNPAWGQQLNPQYKQMLLSDDFVPLSELSRAFMQPKSPMHLQFAYFESSLAVGYLIEVHGLELLLKLLDDLGMGVPLDEAFARRYGDTRALDDSFAAYAKGMANAFLEDTEFDRESLPKLPSLQELQQLVQEQPANYYAQRLLVDQWMRGKQWPQALEAAQRLVELYPTDAEPDGGLALVASIARELQKTELETRSLQQLVALSGDNVEALKRLSELSLAAERWGDLRLYSQQLLAVQPLVATGHENLVLANRRLGRTHDSVEPLRALMELEPIDVAQLQYQLAEALQDAGDLKAAKREVLKALELSPRYRDAHSLLLSIHRSAAGDGPAAVSMRARLPDAGRPPTP